MGWIIEYDPDVLKDFKKLNRSIRREIDDYLHDRVAAAKNPRQHGKPLVGNMRGLWRYRVRDYRIVCQIQDQKLVVLVVAIGHRSTVYE